MKATIKLGLTIEMTKRFLSLRTLWALYPKYYEIVGMISLSISQSSPCEYYTLHKKANESLVLHILLLFIVPLVA